MKSYVVYFTLLISLTGLISCQSSRISTVTAPGDVEWRQSTALPDVISPQWATAPEMDSSLVSPSCVGLAVAPTDREELLASAAPGAAVISQIKERSQKPEAALKEVAQNKKAPGNRLMNLVTKMAIKKAMRQSAKWQAKEDDDHPRRNAMTRNNFFIIGAVFLAAGVLLIIFGGVPGTIIASIMGLILLVAALALLVAALALNLFNGNSISIG